MARKQLKETRYQVRMVEGSWNKPYIRRFLSSQKDTHPRTDCKENSNACYCKLNPRSPAADEFIEVDRCPQFGRETMAGSFTGMHSAVAFRFRLRPNRCKVQRQRSLRLLGGRAKVSSGRLSVRFRVSRFDLNPWQRVKVRRSHFARLVCGSGEEGERKVAVCSSR